MKIQLSIQVLNVFKHYKFTTLETLKQLDELNKEGFVVKFLNYNFRMKIKFQTYIKLHKMKTNLSRKQLIEMMKNESIPNIPDESFNEQLKLEYKKRCTTCKGIRRNT